VMDHFEVNLFPMKIQLEREVGKRLFEYMFPGTKDDKTAVPGKKSQSSFMVPGMIHIEDDDEDFITTPVNTHNLTFKSGGRKNSITSTRAGSLELRLRPTMTSENRPVTSAGHKTKTGSDNHPFRLFQSNKTSTNSRTSNKTLTKKTSLESLQSTLNSRPGIVGRSSTQNSNVDSITSGETKTKRAFAMGRSNKTKKEAPSDDLTKMMTRASEYKTLAYVKIPSVTLCLSYKGKGDRNIEDVHNFVFRLPMIEYRNKTWSNLDLALALKKDIIRALISHTGAIIGNKFSKHRPTTAQQNRLREIATSSMLLAPSNDNSYENSDASSTFATSPTDTKMSEPRRSFASSSNGDGRTGSASDSVYSFNSSNRGQAFPSSLVMTPADNHEESLAPDEMPSSKSTKSMKSGHEEHDSKSANFMLNTLNRLKKSAASGTSEEGGEDTSRKKSKSLLGKIVG